MRNEPTGGAGPPAVAVGLLGYGFIARAHAIAYQTIPRVFWPDPIRPELHAIAGRTEDRVAEEADRLGFNRYYRSWEDLIADETITLFDNCAAHHMHVEPTIAALQAGKNVICEKPLALSAEDAARVVAAANISGTKHMAGFNYRFLPAIRFARDLIERGLLGTIYHLRVQYLQQTLHDPDVPMRRLVDPASARAGAQAILGCHAVDLARFLVGEIATVSALTPRFADERLGPDRSTVRLTWDDAALSLVEFANGAVGTIEASRVATGRRNSLRLEISGSSGSLGFDLERLNELQVDIDDARSPDLIGPRTVMVTNPVHPYGTVWWPDGHVLGWEHALVHQLHHLVHAIVRDEPVAPQGATLEDGYRAAVVGDAITEAALTGRRQELEYLY